MTENSAAEHRAAFARALHSWYAVQQDRAMEAQFLAPESALEAEEHAAWAQIQAAAAKRLFSLTERARSEPSPHGDV